MKPLLTLLLFAPLLLLAQPNTNQSFGVSTDMYIVNGRLPYIDVNMKGHNCIPANPNCLQGKFLLDYGTDTSTIDVYGFPGDYITYVPNKNYTINLFQTSFTSYFYDNQGYHYYNLNGVRQAGILGTDFLSQHIITLDYDNRKAYCGDTSMPDLHFNKLKSLGFIPASMKGYFSNDEKKLLDLKLPQKNNNPAIPLYIGETNNYVQCPAQLDPGYDDNFYTNKGIRITNVININKAYFDTLVKQHIISGVDKNDPILLGNRNSADTLYKCVFTGSFDIKILGVNAESILKRNSSQWNVYLKISSQEGLAAGGITTFPFPAAQIGASLLTQCSRVIFDPFLSLLWFQEKTQ